VDGRVFIDWTDDGKRYGPVHIGGRIGLRQMEWSVARCRTFGCGSCFLALRGKTTNRG